MLKQRNSMMGKVLRNLKNLSLRTKILASYLICIILPLLIFGGILYKLSVEKIINERCAVANQSVKQYNKIFDEYIRQVDALTLLPYIDKNLQNYLLKTTNYHMYKANDANSEGVYSFLESQFQVNKWIDCISIVSLDGRILSQSKYGRVKAEYSVIGNAFYDDFFLSTGEITLSKLHKPKYMFAPIKDEVTVGRKILDFNQGFYSGYILVDCSTDIFERACEKINSNNEGYILVTDKNGNLLYSSGNTKEKFNQSTFDMIIDKNNEGFIRSICGKKVIVTSDKSNITDWQVYSIQPYSIILDSVQPIKVTFILLMSACLSLGIICSIVISKSVTGPLFRLKKTINKIQLGNTKLRAQVENSGEVGQLSQTFNQLLDRIEYLLTSIKSIELKSREAQLDALKSKINPHFLYNTLESIRMMAVIDDKLDIARAIEALADLFRYTIRLKKDIIDIETEIEYINNYILLQKIRYEDNLHVIYNIDPALLNHKIIKLTLQPLVENALKYGIDKNSGKGTIIISVILEKDCLNVSVIDDGAGMSEDKLEEIRNLIKKDDNDQHIGLKNINERIQLYFGSQYGLEIESKLYVGTKVSLRIPDYENEELVMKNAVSISG